jgi:hypothetical protein
VRQSIFALSQPLLKWNGDSMYHKQECAIFQLPEKEQNESVALCKPFVTAH